MFRAWLTGLACSALLANAADEAAVVIDPVGDTHDTARQASRIVRRGRLQHQRGMPLEAAGALQQSREATESLRVPATRMNATGPVAVGPGADLGERAIPDVPEDAASRSGRSLCEGHGYTAAHCDAVGCCEYKGGSCWSLVGDNVCEKPYSGRVLCTLKLKVRGASSFASDMNAMYTLEHTVASSASVTENLVTSRMKCVEGCKPPMYALPRCIQDCKAWKGLTESAASPPTTKAMCEVMAWCEGDACDAEMGQGALQKFVKDGCHDPEGVVEVKFFIQPPSTESAQDVFMRMIEDNPTDDVVSRMQGIYKRIAPDAYIEAVEPMTITVSSPKEDLQDVYEDDVLFDFEVTRIQLGILGKETSESITGVIQLVLSELTGSHPHQLDVSMASKAPSGGLKVSVTFQVPEIGNKPSNIGAKLNSRGAVKSFIDIADKIRVLAGNPDSDGGLVYCIPGAIAIVKSDRKKLHFRPVVPSEGAKDSVVGQALGVAEEPHGEKGAKARGEFPGWVTKSKRPQRLPGGDEEQGFYGAHKLPASQSELMYFGIGSAVVGTIVAYLVISNGCCDFSAKPDEEDA